MPPSRTFIETTSDLGPLLRPGRDFCVVTESDEYPGELLFLHTDQVEFVEDHRDFLSSYCLLNSLFMLDRFLEALDAEGVDVFFLPPAKPIVDKFDAWNVPLQVDGLDLPDGLYPFQQFGLRMAFDSMLGSRRKVGGFFYNFGTGTGKSVMLAAGARELVVNRDEVDLVLAFTPSRMRINLARAITAISGLPAVVPDGAKAKRQRQYGEVEQVAVLNYEKARFDFDEIAALIENKRVLWCYDEVQKVLRGQNHRNKSRQALDDLMKVTARSYVWPLSASVVKASPLRYHDVFQVVVPRHHPLGSRQDFIDRYCREVRQVRLKNGAETTIYDWDVPQLTEVRHRVAAYTLPVRKTDPGVREFFKGIQTLVVPVQQSRDERRLYEAIEEEAAEHPDEAAQYYLALRSICNTPASLRYSRGRTAQDLAVRYASLLDTPSTKFAMIADKIEEIRDQGDQVVVFTQWTYLTLYLFAKELAERGIEYVTHDGEMSTARSQAAQDRFKAEPDITVFLSSDAGATGLNFQNARYVINIECPYDPDLLMQRNDRIDRADSHLDGLTSFIYVCDDSVEERVWEINQQRRAVSETLQGTTETLSRYSADELSSLMRMTEQQAAGRLIRPR